MKLRQKLLLSILPVLLAGTLLLGTISYLHSRGLIFDYERNQLALHIDQVLTGMVERRQRLLDRTGTADVPSFVEAYKLEALRDIDAYAARIKRDIRVFDLESGALIHSTGPPATGGAEHRRGREKVASRNTGAHLYADARSEAWNWRLVVSTPMDQILGSLARIRNATILVTVVSVVIAGLVFHLFSRRTVIAPIDRLQRAAARIARNEPIERIDVEGRDEIAALARDLEGMAEAISRYVREAEAAAEAKSAFLANMSHEIRTPLNGVLGMAQLLESSGLSQTQRQYLDVIRSSGGQLSQIIDDILDVSKIDAGKVSLEPLPIDLVGLIEKARDLHCETASAHGNHLLADSGGLEALWVRGDPTRLNQCLNNLISNATKFTENGTITISLAAEPAGAEALEVELTVQDTGIGIPDDVQAGLFERFVQSDTSTTRRFGGTGLGLSIVRQLVELMDGKVSVTSAPGAGSRFTLRLPMERAEPLAEDRTTADDDTPPNLGGLRVLVAEDNTVNRLLISKLLKRCRIDCELAVDGLEAVAAAREQDFDLILMDIQMPRLDGVGATRQIRALEGTRGAVPIVALTANVMIEDRERYFAEGMNAHLAKPIDLRQLHQTLKRFAAAATQDEDRKLTAAG